MNDYQFINGFQDIKLSSICKKYKINLGNVISGIASEENLKKVKYEIIRELLVLMLHYKEEDLITLALYDEVLMRLEKENKALKEMI